MEMVVCTSLMMTKTYFIEKRLCTLLCPSRFSKVKLQFRSDLDFFREDGTVQQLHIGREPVIPIHKLSCGYMFYLRTISIGAHFSSKYGGHICWEFVYQKHQNLPQRAESTRFALNL